MCTNRFNIMNKFFLQRYVDVSLKILVLISIALVAKHGYADMLDQQDMKPWEICALCHGLDGVSHMSRFPILAAQKPAYIKKQFLDFRSGKRLNDGGQMQSIVTEISLQDIDQISTYFSALALPQVRERAADEKLYREGERIYKLGRPGLDPCGTCHGKSDSSAPWLDGQHGHYLRKQLDDFRGRLRQNDEQLKMQVIAERITEGERDAVIYFLEYVRFDRTNK